MENYNERVMIHDARMHVRYNNGTYKNYETAQKN